MKKNTTPISALPDNPRDDRVDGGPLKGGFFLPTPRQSHWSRWREYYNPLRALSLARAVAWLEQAQRGWMADCQWVFHFIEMTDADLIALVERRTSAILGLDWDIQVVKDKTKGFSQGLADEQAAFLREVYEGIDNLYDGIEHLAMATFKGFAHLEKHPGDDGLPAHLEILDQWNVVRDGLHGEWKYNPRALSVAFEYLPEANILPEENWIIRTVKRPVDRVGLFKFIRSNLSQKDWDAFVEIYGLPNPIVIGPPGVTPEKAAEYEQSAEEVAKGGSGFLPNGASVAYPNEARGIQPFRDHLRYWQEQLVLAGTGGLLTMLAQSGSGTLAGGAHSDTFDLIARGEGKAISNVFQRQLDQPLLEAQFPGQPRLAYFAIASGESVDVNEVVKQVLTLKQAGFNADAAELSERTGYTLTEAPAPVMGSGAPDDPSDPSDSSDPFGPLKNRRGAPTDAVYAAVAEDLQPLRNRLERILQIADPEILSAKLRAFQKELPQLLKDICADPKSGSAIQHQLQAAFARGWKGKPV